MSNNWKTVGDTAVVTKDD